MQLINNPESGKPIGLRHKRLKAAASTRPCLESAIHIPQFYQFVGIRCSWELDSWSRQNYLRSGSGLTFRRWLQEITLVLINNIVKLKLLQASHFSLPSINYIKFELIALVADKL